MVQWVLNVPIESVYSIYFVLWSSLWSLGVIDFQQRNVKIKCSARTTLHHDVSTSTEVISRLLVNPVFFFSLSSACFIYCSL